MSRSRSNRSSKARKAFLLQKPTGAFTPRVQAVGPEHFGIVAIDCSKPRARYLLADFYGRTLIEPTTVALTAGDLRNAITRIRQSLQEHDVRDVVVAIERTGQYHEPVKRAFRQARFETRLVHPFTSKQYRQPADPENKTDDTDVAAIFRATAQGFGLSEPTWPEHYVTLQLLRRHRRDLVVKNSILCCQIREFLHAAMPGYAECFDRLWEAPTALMLARLTTSAQAVLQAGREGLQQLAAAAHLPCPRSTLDKMLAWAQQAPPGHDQSLTLRYMVNALDDDRRQKDQQILELERRLAHLVCTTPYVLLLRIPGLNIVSIADLAGELGPIEFYLNANAITGRAGLMPARYQSDRIDYSNGPLRRRGHRRLRAVLMQAAANLVLYNNHFRARAHLWKGAGKDPRWIRVKVAKIFSRLLFASVGGRQLFSHPCCQPRHYILDKLLTFHQEHRTPPEQIRQDLLAVVDFLPASTRVDEAQPLQRLLDEQAKRRRGPQPLASVIPLVLARLGLTAVQSTDSESAGS